MNRTVSLILFISVVSLIYFGMHFQVFTYFARGLELSAPARGRLRLFFWIAGLSFFVHILLSRLFKVHFLAFPAYIWLGIIAIAFTVSILALIAGGLFSSSSRKIAWAALTITALISTISLINGLSAPDIRELTIPIKNLPANLSGFTLVQLTDVHMEAYKPDRCITHTMERVNALKPDLVVITGDLIDGDICAEPTLCNALKGLNPRCGVYAITGNHEYYSGLHRFQELARRSQFTILSNSSVTLDGGLQLAGLEDREQRRFNGPGPNPDQAFAGLDPQKPTILLCHRPELADICWKNGAGLILAGHTHAGQIPPMDLIVQFVYEYPCGLYEKNGCFLYTSPGAGYWGPPMRFLSRPEIVKITLISQK